MIHVSEKASGSPYQLLPYTEITYQSLREPSGVEYVKAESTNKVSDTNITFDSLSDDVKSKVEKICNSIVSDIRILANLIETLQRRILNITEPEKVNFVSNININVKSGNECYIVGVKVGLDSWKVIGVRECKGYEADEFNLRCYITAHTFVTIHISNTLIDNLNLVFNYYILNDKDNTLIKIVKVESLFINELYRRNGIGTSIFNCLKKDIQVLGIIVFSPVFNARDFYARNGIYLVVCGITPEIYNYIKEYLNFQLTPFTSIYPNINKLEGILRNIGDRLSDSLLMVPSEENIKGYYIDIIINSVSVRVCCGIWFNREQLDKVTSIIDVKSCSIRKPSQSMQTYHSQSTKLRPRSNG